MQKYFNINFLYVIFMLGVHFLIYDWKILQNSFKFSTTLISYFPVTLYLVWVLINLQMYKVIGSYWCLLFLSDYFACWRLWIVGWVWTQINTAIFLQLGVWQLWVIGCGLSWLKTVNAKMKNGKRENSSPCNILIFTLFLVIDNIE